MQTYSTLLTLEPLLGRRQGVDSTVRTDAVRQTDRGLAHTGGVLVNHASVSPDRPGVWRDVATMSYVLSGPAAELRFAVEPKNTEPLYLSVRFQNGPGSKRTSQRPLRYLILAEHGVLNYRLAVPDNTSRVTFSLRPIRDAQAAAADGATVDISSVEVVAKGL